eukprot:CAMPEP_0118717150 /NCGR_PEP_ID=MMETSP0800-20121206/27954_1 /TAXON_ID=210618 ORGANISM="Striatella unipunctata, Strain CCMP2910" /NCGR_SAMPLE_ID=MMETSP0800 /ASSEMBLY_ACC=CAM_ASM_000638 /LENGTH=77 /DNA_ID=CAMNT_0006623765 /DNA_START=596 /DNA_END=829 /DNA_ORIENTATION=-
MPRAHRGLEKIIKPESIAGQNPDKIRSVGKSTGQVIIQLHPTQNLVHGNIYPWNITQSDDGDAKLTDLDALVDKWSA